MSDRRHTPVLAGPHQKVAALDGVRGFAILFVLVYHFTLYGGMQVEGMNAFDHAFRQIALTGWFGVDLFFVLSGFLITGILFDAKGEERYFRTFYMRRTLRIFPLYYGFLAAYFLAIALLAGSEGRSATTLGDQAWYWSYLVNVRYAVADWPEYPILAHFWSLAVEEQFYLVWPVVVFALHRGALMRVCVICFPLALALRVGIATSELHDVGAYVLTPCRMDALLAGGFLALFLRGGAEAQALVRRWLPATFVPALLLLGIFLWRGGLSPRDPAVYTAGFTLLSLLFVGVLAWSLFAAEGSRAGRVFSSRALRFLGRYSYGLYVYHHLVIFALKDTALAAHNLPQLFGSQLPGQLAVFVVATAASIGLSLASWYLFELRFLRLKRFFELRISSPADGTPVRGKLMQAPTVTVLMAAYNAQDFLREAVDSVLAQDFTDYEFVIINDGSTDATTSILEEYELKDPRIRVFYQENRGHAHALNFGLRKARGRYIARMDSDDVSLRHRLGLQVAALDQHPSAVLVAGSVDLIDPNGAYHSTHFTPTSDQHLRRALFIENPLYHPSVIIRRATLEAIGGYDTTDATANIEDYDLYLRLAERGELIAVPHVMIRYRVHPESVSVQNKQMQNERIGTMRSELWRSQTPSVAGPFELRGWLKEIANSNSNGSAAGIGRQVLNDNLQLASEFARRGRRLAAFRQLMGVAFSGASGAAAVLARARHAVTRRLR